MNRISISKAKPWEYTAIRKMVWQSHQNIYGEQPIPEADESFFEWAYSDETLDRLAREPRTWQGVATTDNGEIVGYTVIQLDTNGAAELMRHYVSPNFQRQGIGSLLLDSAIAQLNKFGPVKRVWLPVLRENPVGRSFYEGYGFVHTRDEGVHPQYGALESYYVYNLPEAQLALTY